jgi:DNA-binding transcriptional MerR regulator
MIKPQAHKHDQAHKHEEETMREEAALDIPYKLFYKIGEVSRITKLEPYVLRYWETEFVFLRPRKGQSKQRMYQKKDIEILLEIKRLLYHERFTIEGVRKKLARSYMDQPAERTPVDKTPKPMEDAVRITGQIGEQPDGQPGGQIGGQIGAGEGSEVARRQAVQSTLEDIKGRLRGILRTLRQTGA